MKTLDEALAVFTKEEVVSFTWDKEVNPDTGAAYLVPYRVVFLSMQRPVRTVYLGEPRVTHVLQSVQDATSR